MLRNNPLVSVYIPTRNRATLLRRALLSIATQDYKNIEVILVDDCSSDNTQSVVNEFANIFNKLDYHRNEIPKGACAARNLAIEMCTGDFVTGLDDDDFFLPSRISNFLEVYDYNCSFLCTPSIVVDKNSSSTANFGKRIILLSDLLYRNIVGNQIFIRKSRILDTGAFDWHLQAAQDYDLWIRLVDKYGPAMRLGNPSIVIDKSSENRITSRGATAVNGYQQFIAKHKSKMTRGQLSSQYFSVLLASNYFSLEVFLRSVSFRNLLRFFKFLVHRYITKKHRLFYY